MDTKIAITHVDEKVTIMSFQIIGRGNVLPFGAQWADKARGEWIREPTFVNIEDEISRSSFLNPVISWRIIDEKDIPKDRTYRNALRDRGQKLDWDMPTARELHKEKIRHARASAFIKLDGDYQRASGQLNLRKNEGFLDSIVELLNEETIVIETRRQKLRDMPNDPRIEAAQTTSELKALWNKEELGEI